MHLSSNSAPGLSAFFLSFLMIEGENRHLAELLQPLVGFLLLYRIPLLLLHICCLSCVNLMFKKISDLVLASQSKSDHCVFEEVLEA